jgi:hypothetical protein
LVTQAKPEAQSADDVQAGAPQVPGSTQSTSPSVVVTQAEVAQLLAPLQPTAIPQLLPFVEQRGAIVVVVVELVVVLLVVDDVVDELVEVVVALGFFSDGTHSSRRWISSGLAGPN